MASRRPPKALLAVTVVVAAVILLIALAAAVTVALVMPVRSEITLLPEEYGAPAPDNPAPAEPGEPRTIAAEAAGAAQAIRASGEAWHAHVTGVEVVTWLRRPLIVVSTDIGAEQADLSDEFIDGILGSRSVRTASDGSERTFFFEVRSADGDVIGAAGSTDDRWLIPDVPGPPVNAEGLHSWLEAVYGPASPAPEPWYRHIRAVRDENESSDRCVVVTTDLDPAAIADGRVAETIIAAVNSSGATFAPTIRVLFADGVYEWTALLDGVDPYRM